MRELKVRPDKIISDDLKNYPEIELKWSEPGIAFRVTFRKKNYTPEMSEKTREKILSILKATSYITINELAEIVGISQKGIEWQIAKLKKEGKIKRIGSDKGGHWEVIK
ncbi:MAG: winged helix-turn-helix domain-containing protein [Candidatus Helarchaeota archaeon]